jgi:hypothetical protein
MFSRFFIDRPIFAVVVSVLLVLAGLAAMRSLPIAQYPEIAPPVVTVQATYPGASAEVLESTVAAPLENAINGLPGMIYMSSNSSSNGVAQIQVTFEIGTSIDIAAVNVSNRVKQVETRLPLEVRRQGVTVEPGSSAFLQVLAFYSPDGRYDDLFTSNYVTLNVLDRLKRLPGTTNVQIFGAKDYAMRIWLKPGPPGAVEADTRPDVAARSTSRTRSSPPARSVSRRSAGPGPGLHDHLQGSPVRPGAVQRDHRPRQPRRLDRCACRRGARRAGFQAITNSTAATTASRRRWSASSCARRQRARRRQGACKAAVDELQQRFPRGPDLRRSLRHHALRQGVDRGGAEDAGRGDAAGVPGGVLFLQNWRATLIPFGRAGVADRHLRRHLRCSAIRSTR